MANDLKAFSKRIQKVGTRLELSASGLAQDTASYMCRHLNVEETPVDTGQARDNWIASVGTPVTQKSDKDQYDVTGQSRYRENLDAISRQRPGQDIYITNNLSYIKYLNEGSSKQAPAGFVEAIVQKANTFIKRAKLLTSSK